jgi:hypothetical protein
MVVHQRKDIVMEFAALKQLFVDHGHYSGEAVLHLEKGVQKTMQVFRLFLTTNVILRYQISEDNKFFTWGEFEAFLSQFDSFELSGKDIAIFNNLDGIAHWVSIKQEEYESALNDLPPRYSEMGHFMSYGSIRDCKKTGYPMYMGYRKIGDKYSCQVLTVPGYMNEVARFRNRLYC